MVRRLEKSSDTAPISRPCLDIGVQIVSINQCDGFYQSDVRVANRWLRQEYSRQEYQILQSTVGVLKQPVDPITRSWCPTVLFCLRKTLKCISLYHQQMCKQ